MGKGSSPRPFSVPHEKFANNWDQIFRKGLNPDNYAAAFPEVKHEEVEETESKEAEVVR
jgi:hypothetical protein